MFSPYRGPNHGLLSNLSKSPREILATKKATRSFEQPPRMFGSRRSRDMSKYCHFHEDYGHDTNDYRQLRNQIEEVVKLGYLSLLVKGIKKEKEIIFPSRGSNSSAPVVIKAKVFGREVNQVHMDSGSSCKVIYEHCFMKLKPSIRASKGGQQCRGWKSWFPTFTWPLNSTPPEGLVRYFRHMNPINRHQKAATRTLQRRLRDLLRANADVFAWTHVDMKGIPRTITVKGKSFNIEQKLNEYSHVKPIKQKRRGVGLDCNTAACREVEELTKAGILQEVKRQTWVANPVMVKKSDEGWRMCVDLTNINKACLKDCYPLPEID
nr:reverse transcriptase domain-containing protein [Tanacetum cinerariifolium]